jgi:hypothetical protein
VLFQSLLYYVYSAILGSRSFLYEPNKTYPNFPTFLIVLPRSRILSGALFVGMAHRYILCLTALLCLIRARASVSNRTSTITATVVADMTAPLYIRMPMLDGVGPVVTNFYQGSVFRRSATDALYIQTMASPPTSNGRRLLAEKTPGQRQNIEAIRKLSIASKTLTDKGASLGDKVSIQNTQLDALQQKQNEQQVLIQNAAVDIRGFTSTIEQSLVDLATKRNMIVTRAVEFYNFFQDEVFALRFRQFVTMRKRRHRILAARELDMVDFGFYGLSSRIKELRELKLMAVLMNDTHCNSYLDVMDRVLWSWEGQMFFPSADVVAVDYDPENYWPLDPSSEVAYVQDVCVNGQTSTDQRCGHDTPLVQLIPDEKAVFVAEALLCDVKIEARWSDLVYDLPEPTANSRLGQSTLQSYVTFTEETSHCTKYTDRFQSVTSTVQLDKVRMTCDPTISIQVCRDLFDRGGGGVSPPELLTGDIGITLYHILEGLDSEILDRLTKQFREDPVSFDVGSPATDYNPEPKAREFDMVHSHPGLVAPALIHAYLQTETRDFEPRLDVDNASIPIKVSLNDIMTQPFYSVLATHVELGEALFKCHEKDGLNIPVNGIYVDVPTYLERFKQNFKRGWIFTANIAAIELVEFTDPVMNAAMMDVYDQTQLEQRISSVWEKQLESSDVDVKHWIQPLYFDNDFMDLFTAKNPKLPKSRIFSVGKLFFGHTSIFYNGGKYDAWYNSTLYRKLTSFVFGSKFGEQWNDVYDPASDQNEVTMLVDLVEELELGDIKNHYTLQSRLVQFKDDLSGALFPVQSASVSPRTGSKIDGGYVYFHPTSIHLLGSESDANDVFDPIYVYDDDRFDRKTIRVRYETRVKGTTKSTADVYNFVCGTNSLECDKNFVGITPDAYINPIYSRDCNCAKNDIAVASTKDCGWNDANRYIGGVVGTFRVEDYPSMTKTGDFWSKLFTNKLTYIIYACEIYGLLGVWCEASKKPTHWSYSTDEAAFDEIDEIVNKKQTANFAYMLFYNVYRPDMKKYGKPMVVMQDLTANNPNLDPEDQSYYLNALENDLFDNLPFLGKLKQDGFLLLPKADREVGNYFYSPWLLDLQKGKDFWSRHGIFLTRFLSDAEIYKLYGNERSCLDFTSSIEMIVDHTKETLANYTCNFAKKDTNCGLIDDQFYPSPGEDKFVNIVDRNGHVMKEIGIWATIFRHYILKKRISSLSGEVETEHIECVREVFSNISKTIPIPSVFGQIEYRTPRLEQPILPPSRVFKLSRDRGTASVDAVHLWHNAILADIYNHSKNNVFPADVDQSDVKWGQTLMQQSLLKRYTGSQNLDMAAMLKVDSPLSGTGTKTPREVLGGLLQGPSCESPRRSTLGAAVSCYRPETDNMLLPGSPVFILDDTSLRFSSYISSLMFGHEQIQTVRLEQPILHPSTNWLLRSEVKLAYACYGPPVRFAILKREGQTLYDYWETSARNTTQAAELALRVDGGFLADEEWMHTNHTVHHNVLLTGYNQEIQAYMYGRITDGWYPEVVDPQGESASRVTRELDNNQLVPVAGMSFYGGVVVYCNYTVSRLQFHGADKAYNDMKERVNEFVESTSVIAEPTVIQTTEYATLKASDVNYTLLQFNVFRELSADVDAETERYVALETSTNHIVDSVKVKSEMTEIDSLINNSVEYWDTAIPDATSVQANSSTHFNFSFSFNSISEEWDIYKMTGKMYNALVGFDFDDLWSLFLRFMISVLFWYLLIGLTVVVAQVSRYKWLGW